MEGILILDKPSGLTSHGVVSKVRKALDTRKVGHAGTLDPMATGVLVVGVGRATRLLGYLTAHEKRYQATIRLGACTTTDDADGDILETASRSKIDAVSDDDIGQVLTAMIGEVWQTPSAVSAIKVDGKRAHALVRAGQDPKLSARRVLIKSLAVSDISREVDERRGWIDIVVDVQCSAGTYIRAIARDLGQELGVGGYLTTLRRTQSGPFAIDEAVALDSVDIQRRMMSLSEVANRCFPCLALDAAQARAAASGLRIELPLSGLTALTDPNGSLIALATPGTSQPNLVSYSAVFVSGSA